MTMCTAYGHEVVALANLLPPDAHTDDMDSYMYQTVGHQVIAAYASCCGLPLYRRRIQGHPCDQSLVYDGTKGDEVEDLAALLAFVKAEMPCVQAVASGAIASDYQRTRVERVCERFGLVSLAYLWHQPQAPLLQRMIDAGIDAVLVKIAAAGLSTQKHLGANLQTMLPFLLELRHRYGLNVCGEGGEYETLTLDCPLFKHGCLVLDSWECVSVLEDSMAPVALLHPTSFHVEYKPSDRSADRTSLHTPIEGGSMRYFSDGGRVIQVPDAFVADLESSRSSAVASSNESAPAAESNNASFDIRIKTVHGRLYASITAEIAMREIETATGGGKASAIVQSCLASCLKRMEASLLESTTAWTDAIFVHLYIPSMEYFAAVNEVYASFFPSIHPPARACVAIPPSTSPSIPTMVIEVLFAVAPPDWTKLCDSSFSTFCASNRRALHVQSISEWAPACIGPYAQAVKYLGLLHFAGQIPLDPATMSVIQSDARGYAQRCLMSCQAVAIAMQTDLSQAMLWCTVYTSASDGFETQRAANDVLQEFLATGKVHSSGEAAVPECCECRRNRCQTRSEWHDEEDEQGHDDDDDERERRNDDQVDDYLRVNWSQRRYWRPSLVFVQVPQLPRGCVIFLMNDCRNT